MARGGTRPLSSIPRDGGFAAFQREREAMLVVLSGPAAGRELSLDHPRLTVGRGADVDLRFDDDAMSHSHAALEYADGGFRIVDLESTNGTRVNGASVRIADLDHGDRLELGEHVLQYVLAERRREPRVHVLPGE